MSGEELKELLYEKKITQAELATKLGISTQHMSQALKSADIKSGLLEKIAAALGKDMSFFYAGAGSVTTTGDNNTVQVGNNNSVSTTKDDDDEEIDLNLDTMCDLRDQIKYLKDQNKKLMQWIDKLMNK